MFWYMLSRNRSAKAGIPGYVRATCNPDPDHWVRHFIDWFIDQDGFPIEERSGQLRYFVRDGDDIRQATSKQGLIDRYPHVFDDDHLEPEDLVQSFTFINASVYDNRALLDNDKGYLARLKNMPANEKARLLSGNWNVRLVEGDRFKSDYFEQVNPGDVPDTFDRVVRCWDMADTKPSKQNPDPDYTVGLLVGYERKARRLWVLDMVRFRDDPGGNEERILRTTEEDQQVFGRTECHMERQPGTGKTFIHHYDQLLPVKVKGHYSNRKKETRANAVSASAKQGKVKLQKGAWNRAFLREVSQFGTGQEPHDDIVDTLSLAHKVLTAKKFETSTLQISAL